jgi:steroid 5-alpha reductase family enzyme
MFDATAWFLALGLLAGLGICGWLVSLFRNDVSIVDSLWSLMFLIAAIGYAVAADAGPRTGLVLALVAVWALRLAGYITWRNWGEGEDYRYRAIRQNNSPHFELKSLYIVFGLQSALAWFISLPLLAAISGERPIGLVDVAGLGLWLVGFLFESVGDLQLARFRADPANRGKVLSTGLWRFTRHPNYFGDFCVWWGFYLLALAAGGWWSFPAPLLMTVLLLRVSGVALLEKDISRRRPDYADYVARTNAFFPGPRRKVAS